MCNQTRALNAQDTTTGQDYRRGGRPGKTTVYRRFFALPSPPKSLPRKNAILYGQPPEDYRRDIAAFFALPPPPPKSFYRRKTRYRQSPKIYRRDVIPPRNYRHVFVVLPPPINVDTSEKHNNTANPRSILPLAPPVPV